MDARRIAPHPAKFGNAIIDRMGELMSERIADGKYPPEVQRTVLDPFAGTGRCFEWERNAFLKVTGIEIESEWITDHPRHVLADFIAWAQMYAEEVRGGYQQRFDFIATSPTYGNRMADKHEARDESKRHTYRHYLDRPLSKNNSGGMQWGPQYRAFHEAAWKLCVYLLKDGGYMLLNVKDHIRQGERQGVPEWHRSTLMGMGLVLVDLVTIDAPGLRHGDNDSVRMPHELVYVFMKPKVREYAASNFT